MSLLEQASLVITPNAYKESVLYSVVPNTTLGDMDVVRTTTKTRKNSVGLIENVAINVPSIDYTNGSCPSLLVEPQRTNLLIRSNAFVGVGWTISGTATITSNFAISPDGTQNAAKLTAATQGTSGIYQLIVGTASVNYSRSIYMKSVSGNTETIRITDPWGTGSDGILVTINGQWNRYTLTSPLALGVNGGIWINNIPTAGIYIYGSQLELGAYPTSYIPTVASTVTRNADLISNSNINNFVGNNQGTFVYDFQGYTQGSSVGQPYWGYLSDGSKELFFYDSGIYTTINASFQFIANLPSGTIPFKVAYRWNASFISIFINGIKIIDFAKTAAFNPTYFAPTSNSNVSKQIYNNIIGFNIGLTDAECLQLTTL